MGPMRKAGKESEPMPQNARPTIGWLTQAEVNTLSVAMWRGADEAAREHGVNLLHVPGDILESPIGYLAQSNALYDLLGVESLDGLIVWGGLLSQYISIEQFKAFCARYQPLPVVNIGMPVQGIPSVWLDNYTGMRDAVRHLVEVHDCRRIAFLRGVVGAEAEERYRAYADVLTQHGIPYDADLVTPPSDQQRADGAAAVRLLLDERQASFEALIASTDALALGALDVLHERGIGVPGGVKVVGFDDVEEAAATTPPLSTVRQPMYELTKKATEMLLALMAGEEVPERATLKAEFVTRESCGCPDMAVIRAAAGEIKAIADGGTGREALEASLTARREEIVSQMEQALGAPVENMESSWAERLLDAFTLEMLGQTSGAFVSTLNEILQQVASGGGDVGTWQGVLSALRHHVLPCLVEDQELLLGSEDLWQQARVVVARTAERIRAHRTLLAQQLTERLREIGQALMTTTGMDDLADVLAQQLPRLDIPSCYLALYEDPALPAERARLILAYDAGGRVELRGEGLRFSSRRLVPGGLRSRDDRFSLSLEPLYFEQSQYGFALLELGPEEAEVRETLRTQLSSALQKTLLIRERETRAVRLETAAQVSHAASSILEPEALIQQVVDLIRTRFDLYYVGLFLVEQATEESQDQWAVLRAGTGEAGQQMVAEGHRLKVGGDSMIGRCVAEGQARIALDVGVEAVRFENPLLPATRSEMALPLIAHGDVTGALTVQSDREAAFGQEDLATLQLMASQVAVALENARLYDEAQREIAERTRAEQALSQEQYLMNALMDTLPDAIYFKDRESNFVRINRTQADRFSLSHPSEAIGKSDFDFFTDEHARPAFEDEQRIIKTEQPLLNLEERETWPDRPDTWVSTSKLPLYDEEGKLVGTYGVSRDITDRKVAQEALQRRSTQLETAAEVSRAASSILDSDALLQQAVDLVREGFDLYHVGLFLVDRRGDWTGEPGAWAVLRAATGEAGRQMVERRHRLAIGGESMIGWCVANKATRVALDVGDEPVRFENPLLPKTRSEMALPLISRGEAIGALTIQSSEPAAFTDEDIVVLQTMADQLANAIENARLFEQSQNALRELEAAQRRYMRLAWADYTAEREGVRGFLRTEKEEGPTAEAWLPTMSTALEQKDTTIAQDAGDGSSLAIPLTVHGEVIGVLGGHRRGAASWDEDDIAAVEAIIEQMALALDNQRLFDEEQHARQLMDQRVKELDCLGDVGRQIDEAPTIPEFLEWVAERVPPAMQYPGLCVVGIDFEGEIYGVPEALGLPCQIVQSLVIGGEQLGRVCIAYTEEREFLDEESALLGDIARRIGGYIENRRLFEETQAALSEVESVHRSYLRRGWQDHLRQRAALERSGFVYDLSQGEQPEEATAVPDLWLPEMEQALSERGAATSGGDGGDGERTGLAIPIVLRGETIGVLGVEAPGGQRKWTEEEQGLIAAVSEQLAQTLESARLFAESQRRAERELRVREITDRVRAALDLERLAQTAAEELARTLGASEVAVRLQPPTSPDDASPDEASET